MTNFRNTPDQVHTLLRLQDNMNRMFNQAAPSHEHISTRVWNPPVDVYEDGEAIVIQVDLPGLRQEEIEVELTDDTLTIRGERRFEDEERRDRYVRIERHYGSYQRTFTVSVPIQEDKVKASYRSGVLQLTLPKAEAVKPRKVQVNVG